MSFPVKKKTWKRVNWNLQKNSGPCLKFCLKERMKKMLKRKLD